MDRFSSCGLASSQREAHDLAGLVHVVITSWCSFWSGLAKRQNGKTVAAGVARGGGKTWGKTSNSGQTEKTAYLSWAFCYNFNFGLVHCWGSVSRLESPKCSPNLVVLFIFCFCFRGVVSALVSPVALTTRLGFCSHLKVHLFRSWPIFANYQTGLLQFFLVFLKKVDEMLFYGVPRQVWASFGFSSARDLGFTRGSYTFSIIIPLPKEMFFKLDCQKSEKNFKMWSSLIAVQCLHLYIVRLFPKCLKMPPTW